MQCGALEGLVLMPHCQFSLIIQCKSHPKQDSDHITEPLKHLHMTWKKAEDTPLCTSPTPAGYSCHLSIFCRLIQTNKAIHLTPSTQPVSLEASHLSFAKILLPFWSPHSRHSLIQRHFSGHSAEWKVLGWVLITCFASAVALLTANGHLPLYTHSCYQFPWLVKSLFRERDIEGHVHL